MKTYGWFEKEYNRVKNNIGFKLADLEIELTEKILQIMEDKEISRTDLADRLNVSKASISKLLNNGSNMTLKRILSIADALDCNFSVKIEDKSAQITSAILGQFTKFGESSKIEAQVSYNYNWESEPLVVSDNKIFSPDDYCQFEKDMENVRNAA